MKNIIVAYDRNRVIGHQNELPWKGEFPADMKRFKEVTMGTALVMGRLTFESIGRPLPGRENIIVTSSSDVIQGCSTVPSLNDAYDLVDSAKDISIIGGERIFAEALSVADRILATEIDAEFTGDRYFPKIDKAVWRVASQESHAADIKNKWPYSFVIFEALR